MFLGHAKRKYCPLGMGLLFIPRCTEPDFYSVIKAGNILTILLSQTLGNRQFGKPKKNVRY
jgi:hypothetical protein